MAHDPDGKEDDDEDDGKRREKNKQVPTRSFFTPNIEKADGLDCELNHPENENNENGSFGAEMKKFGLDDDKESP